MAVPDWATEWGPITGLATILSAWVGKLHSTISGANRRVGEAQTEMAKLKGDSVTREELQQTLRDERESQKRLFELSAESRKAQFNELHRAVARLDANITNLTGGNSNG